MTVSIPAHNKLIKLIFACGLAITFLCFVQWSERGEEQYRQKFFSKYLANKPISRHVKSDGYALNNGHGANNNTAGSIAKTRYYVRTEHCRMPYVNPFSSEIKKIYKSLKIENCSTVERLIETIFDANLKRYYLHIREDVGRTLRNYSGDISCCFKQIIRKTGKDNDIIVLPCINFEQNFLVPRHIEGIIVECYSANSTKLLQMDGFTFIQMKNLTNVTANASRKPSVLLLGIDGLSRINFRRTMLKTYEYVKRNDWYELQGYNKMGDNTFPNLMAILAGYNSQTAIEKCRVLEAGGIDACALIWKNFRNRGYRTAYAEDESEMSTFNYLKHGFLNPPTDYYLRPFMLAFERHLEEKKRCGLRNCLGMRHTAQYIYDFAIQLANRYNDEPVFGLFWSNSFSHNCYDTPSAMDHIIQGYMLDLQKLGILETSIVIFFSDHGMRWGTLNELADGFFEERLPMLFIWLPKWFREQYPKVVQALDVNRNRLTSPYDLHMTLKHLVELAGGEANAKLEPAHDCPKCQSVFLEIPENRTCDDAGIPEHWCTCIPYEVMVKNATFERIARLVVDAMNRYLSARHYSDVCSELSLHNVDTVFRRMLLENEQPHINMYRIKFETKPNRAMFQSTVVYHENNKSITLDVESISRLTSYELDSKCINDKQKRRKFFDWALEKMRQDDEFYRKIIFSDEAHFWLNRFVNKQNMRYWLGENPHVLHESPLHLQKITVWCGLHVGGVIGPQFFVDDNDRNVTVNGHRYRAMITDYFWLELEDMDFDDMWFQQDGATSHKAYVTVDLLKSEFDERVISRNGPVDWQCRLYDLTSQDYFLWGYVKSLVYVNKPTTLEEPEPTLNAK